MQHLVNTAKMDYEMYFKGFALIDIASSFFHPDRRDTILHQSIRSKNIDLVRRVLDTGGDTFINSLNGKSRSPIHIAIEEQLYQIVELLVSTAKEKIDANQCLIHHAIAKGNMNMVELLVKNFSVDTKNQENMTVFCVAFKEEKFEILDYLLSKVDASSNIYNDHALFYVAIIRGNLEIVKRFLESKFPINDSIESSPDGWYILNDYAGFAPLHFAVKYLRLSIVELLLNRGADILKINKAESTALHLAFEAKMKGIWKTWQNVETNDKIIDLLLDVKVKNSAKLTNRVGISHLHIACSRDKPEVIESYLEDRSISASDFASCDNQGFSPLHFAAKYRCHKVAKLLLQYDVDVNQRDDEYRTPLHVASKKRCLEMVQLLMQHGADPTVKDCHSNTPVHMAFNDRNYAILDLLITYPKIADSNPIGTAGISHFHIACTRNDVNVVKGFVDSGVSVDLQVPMPHFKINYAKHNKDLDWRGCAPLHFAAAFNRSKVVESLLTHGADARKKDARGSTPIHLACQQSYDRFGELIETSLRNFVRKLESTPSEVPWLSLLSIRPHSDVTHVEEETTQKPLESFYRKFTSIASHADVFESRQCKIIDWQVNGQEQVDTIKFLVGKGADLNDVDIFGNTPLVYVCEFNVHQILAVFDKKLRSYRMLGSVVATSFLAQMYDRRRQLLDVIFKLGVRVNVDKSYNNGSILHYICRKNEFWDVKMAKMLEYFLKRNADPDALDALGRTPLHVLAKNAHACELYISNAKVEITRSRETMALEKMIETLLRYNARVDFRNGDGQTPLFEACLTKKFTLMQILLHHGADVNAEDNDGQTALLRFYKTHVKELARTNTLHDDVWIIAKTLVEHVKAIQAVGFRVGENVENPMWQMNRYLKMAGSYDDLDFKEKLEKEVEELKSTGVKNQMSLYDVLIADEHRVSRGVIIEQLGKMLNESCRNSFPNYFHFINHKYNVAVERKRLLREAKQALNRVLATNFPEVCSEFIFMWLKNVDLASFIIALVGYPN